MEMLLLKALREGNSGHELQQMSSFFSSHLSKFKLETQLKTLTHIVDEKQVEIKISQKLLASEVLELVKLILLVLANSAVSERLCSMLRRVKTY